MPAVGQCIKTTEEEIYGNLRILAASNKRLICAGDGQYESPGRCAKTCTYTKALCGIEERIVDQSGATKTKYMESG